MSGNFTVISNEDAVLFEQLKTFYKEVAKLTINHNVLNDNAVVYPSDLGPALEKIDPYWFEKAL